MLKKILLGIGIIIAIVLLWLVFTDGSYDVKRSTVINAPQATVFEAVSDLNTWTSWSPWLIMEPDAEVVVTGNPGSVGNFYSWKGELVGSGEMENMELSAPSSLVQEIRFTDPFPSSSTVYWELAPSSEGVKITWGMKGEMPFLFKFMAKQMEPMIGMDYERGLRMLKEYIETGNVLSKLKVTGKQDIKGFRYIGLKSTVKWDEIGDAMGSNYGEIITFMNANGLTQADAPLSIYADFAPGKDAITFVSAIPYTGEADIPDKFETGEYPDGSSFIVTHWGKYEHIGNAWSAGFSATRYNKLKINSKLAPYEVYITDPMTEPDQGKWETKVVLPLK